MDNMKIYNAVAEVPDGAKNAIKGGKLTGFTDINPMWRINQLTEQFGPAGIGWYYVITNQRLEPNGDEIAAFVDIDLYVKIDGEWSKPISGIGGSKFVAIQRGKPEMSDECFKMALTDAISVACKALGFGANVYWANGRSKYNMRKADEQVQEPPITDKQKEQMKELLKQVAKAYATTANSVLAQVQKEIGTDVNSMTAKQAIAAMQYLSKSLQNAQK